MHEFLRDELDIRSIIPPKIGRPTDKPPKGRYRRLMAQYFKRPPEERRYGQRWQVETVFSMIKRRLGETVSARSYHRQNRALRLKAIAHNVLILLWLMRFSTEQKGLDFCRSGSLWAHSISRPASEVRTEYKS